MPLYPGLMVPPYTIRAGLFRRAIAITTPGIFLSHPGSEMFASYHCKHIKVQHPGKNPLGKMAYSAQSSLVQFTMVRFFMLQSPVRVVTSKRHNHLPLLQPFSQAFIRTCAPMTVSTLSAMRSRDCRL